MLKKKKKKKYFQLIIVHALQQLIVFMYFFWDVCIQQHIVIKVYVKWQNSADNTIDDGDFNYEFPIEYHNAIPNTYDEYRFIQKVRAL